MKKETILSLFLVVALELTGCSILPEKVSEHPNVLVDAVEETSYNLATVERGDIILSKKLFFLYTQTQEEHLSFATEGRRVTGVYAKIGDVVKEGQLLAELYSEDLEEELANYTYQKERLELLNKQSKELYEYDLASAKSSYESGVISIDSYNEIKDSLKSNYENNKKNNDDSLTIIKLRMKQLKEELKGCKVYASLSGVVSFMLPRLEGSTSDKDVNVYRIINGDECLFRMENDEFSNYFEVGQSIHLSISDEIGYDTTVKRIEPKVDGEEGEEVVYLEPDQIDTELAMGTRCYYDLVLDQREDVLYLPNRCVFLADDKAYVFVEDEGGMKSIQYVSIGMIGDKYTEITDGLNEGDIVIRK